MQTANNIVICVIVLCILIVIRNHILQGYYSRALVECSRRSRKIIFSTGYLVSGDGGNECMAPYRQYETHNYSQDMLNLSKWTYAQFFPDFVEDTDAEA